MDYGRPAEFRRSPEFSRHDYPGGVRDYRDNPQRSRSQTRLEPEFIPTDYSPYQSRPLDKGLRSKSLDYRDALRDDQPYFEDNQRTGRGVTIPIRQERKERNYDYDKDLYVPVRRDLEPFDSRERVLDVPRGGDRGGYGREVDIPMERVPRQVARSTEWLDRQRPYDDRRPRVDRHSPKSIASSKKPNLNQSLDAARGRRVDQASDYRRADEFRQGYGNESRDMYRGDFRDGREASRASAAGGGGGGHRSHHQSSYQYESHGGGGGGIIGSPPRRVISAQPTHQLSPPVHGAPLGPGPIGSQGMVGGQYQRPVQYRRYKCCCFTFTWPPWSYEPTTPPQPIYRNI